MATSRLSLGRIVTLVAGVMLCPAVGSAEFTTFSPDVSREAPANCMWSSEVAFGTCDGGLTEDVGRLRLESTSSQQERRRPQFQSSPIGSRCGTGIQHEFTLHNLVDLPDGNNGEGRFSEGHGHVAKSTTAALIASVTDADGLVCEDGSLALTDNCQTGLGLNVAGIGRDGGGVIPQFSVSTSGSKSSDGFRWSAAAVLIAVLISVAATGLSLRIAHRSAHRRRRRQLRRRTYPKLNSLLGITRTDSAHDARKRRRRSKVRRRKTRQVGQEMLVADKFHLTLVHPSELDTELLTNAPSPAARLRQVG